MALSPPGGEGGLGGAAEGVLLNPPAAFSSVFPRRTPAWTPRAASRAVLGALLFACACVPLPVSSPAAPTVPAQARRRPPPAALVAARLPVSTAAPSPPAPASFPEPRSPHHLRH